MMKTMIKKLKNKKGESLSEVLVASLFVSLAFVMILGMIMDNFLVKMVKEGTISVETAIAAATDPEHIKKNVGGQAYNITKSY